MSHEAPFRFAAAMMRRCRRDFDDVQRAAYLHAEEDCRGRLLNREGMRAGISSLSLFEGTEARAMKYASEELRDHWRTHPRPSLHDYADQWFANLESELTYA
jgi:hypothetical protein